MKEISESRVMLKEHLSDEEACAVRKLAEECARHEPVALKLELDYKLRARPEDAHQALVREVNEFLCFRGPQLIGYLGICAFGGPGSALEITGMVHPAFRRQGVFTLLYALAAAESGRRGAREALLLCDRDSAAGQKFLQKVEAEYAHSEFEMYLRDEFPEIRPEQLRGVSLRKATNADAREVARQNAIYFGEGDTADEPGEAGGDSAVSAAPNAPADAFAILPEDEEKRGMTIYIAEQNGETVGKVHLETSAADTGGIYGLGVLPERRGKGLGRAILLCAVAKLREAGIREIMLQVEAKNATALTLYESCGFQRNSTMDYFRVIYSIPAFGQLSKCEECASGTEGRSCNFK